MNPRALSALVASAFVAVTVSSGAVEILSNTGYEVSRPGGGPAEWQAADFNTGGGASRSPDRGRAGGACVILESADATERICWRQRGPLPPGTPVVSAGGWYRTEGVRPAAGRGATLRVHFYGPKEGRLREISLQQAFFPPADDWTRAGPRYMVVPEGATEVELQVFNWLTPGTTCWDDVWLRGVNQREVQQIMPELAENLGIDRPPVAGTNVPYAPADGATVGINPPTFLWLPVPNGLTQLEISPDAGFSEETTIRRTDLEWCAEPLTAPLAPGSWYWRYGLALPAGTVVWSKARRFTVPGDALVRPYPGPEDRRVGQARPRLFVCGPEALRDIRRRAADGDLKRTAESLRRAVRRHAGTPLVAEPDWLPGGKDRGPAYTLCFRETRPPMDRMETAALAYLLTGDPAAGQEARRRLLHFFAWDPHGPTNVFHNDEPAMWIMMRGVRAYDWTYDLLTPEEREVIEACIVERARDFYIHLRRRPFENNPFSSHPGRIIGFLGEAAILLSPEYAEAREWLDYITRIYWAVYPAWGREDGGWNEGPMYWSAYMQFGLHFVVALRNATGIDLAQRPFFRNTPYYRLYLTPPYSKHAPFGDGKQFKPHRVGPLMYWFSTLTRDPHLRWYSDALGGSPGNGILGVVLRDASLAGQPPTGLPPARHFPGVGLVCLHTNLADGEENVAFAMRSSPYGAVSHGHNDQNCFTLEAFGEPLAIASGHYNRYGSDHHDGWTRQTKAKCGITIDGGKGQARGWQARGAITAYLHTEAVDIVEGDAAEAYGGRLTRALRQVVHLRPGVFVIRDDLAAPKPATFEYWLHALDEMQVDRGRNTVSIRRPASELRVHVLAPADPVVTQTGVYDPPVRWLAGRTYEDTWHLALAHQSAARTGEFLTVLQPFKTGGSAAEPELRRLSGMSATGVDVRWPDRRRDVVLFARGDGPIDLAGIASRSRICVVRYDADGNVVASAEAP